MPKMVQIRNVPDDLHRSLKAQAAEEGLSLSDFLLRELRTVAARPRMADVLERARRRRSRGVSADAIVEVIREGRERRG